MDFEKERIAQLQLPDPADADPHPGYSWRAGVSMPGSAFLLCSLMAGTTLPWR